MLADSKVKLVDESWGLIKGIAAPFAEKRHRTKAGVFGNLEHYKGHWVTKDSTILTPGEGIHVWADHHYDLGPCGQGMFIRSTLQGIEALCLLWEAAAHFTFEQEGRTLPRLLQEGKLFFCADLVDVVLASDGFLVRATITGLNLTEHPAAPRLTGAAQIESLLQ